jgi:hypothetical protein
MSDDILVRSYHPNDFEAIKRIHEQNRLDFAFPNLNSGLFPAHKVLLLNGEVKAAYALRIVTEANLWMARDAWTDAEGKWMAIKALDRETTEAAAVQGLDAVQCFLPPGYERFGRRICGKDGLGFEKDRPGWSGYSKLIGAKTCV